MKTLEVLEEMFLDYVRGESFGDLTEDGRNEVVNAYEELKQLASGNKLSQPGPLNTIFGELVN